MCYDCTLDTLYRYCYSLNDINLNVVGMEFILLLVMIQLPAGSSFLVLWLGADHLGGNDPFVELLGG